MTLYEKLQSLSKSDILPLHMPGHKRSHAIENMSDIYDIDITEIDGFDDLHHPTGILADMAERAAQIYGARNAFLSVGGSSAANQAAIMTLCRNADSILVDRGCHKSVYYAIELGLLKPVYLRPKYSGLKIGLPVCAEDIEEKLVENPECKTVVITSPTYEGLCADIKSIANTVHSHGALLIVDAAHGAHLGFGDGLPENPIRLGADIVVTSLHKMLPAPTQTALLLTGTDSIDLDRLQHYMSVFQSSSPSYVLMAGIGECLKYLEACGKEKIDEAGALADNFRKELSGLINISVEPETVWKQYEYDPFKIVIASSNGKTDGKFLHKRLLEKYRIQCEMYAEKYVLALMSPVDTEDTFQRFACALKSLDDEITSMPVGEDEDGSLADNNGADLFSFPEMKYIPGEAVAKKSILRNLDDSIQGKISADYVLAYPPGIPIVVPGEEYSKEIVTYITKGLEKGLNIIGIKDGKKVLTVE